MTIHYFGARIPTADAAIPHAQRRSFMQLRAHHCRWPIGEGDKMTFCGATREGKFPYCLHHLKRATASTIGEPGL